MPSYQESIFICAPQDAVWRIFSNVVAWPQWLPTVHSVAALDSDPLNLGARYRIVQPKLRPATWVVTCLQAPRHFTWEARFPGLTMTADHRIEAIEPDRSRAVLQMSFGGFLAALAGRRFRSITESYLALEAAALKARAEGDQAHRIGSRDSMREQTSDVANS